MPIDGAHISSEVYMDKSKQSSPHEATPGDSLPRRPDGELEDDSTLESTAPDDEGRHHRAEVRLSGKRRRGARARTGARLTIPFSAPRSRPRATRAEQGSSSPPPPRPPASSRRSQTPTGPSATR